MHSQGLTNEIISRKISAQNVFEKWSSNFLDALPCWSLGNNSSKVTLCGVTNTVFLVPTENYGMDNLNRLRCNANLHIAAKQRSRRFLAFTGNDSNNENAFLTTCAVSVNCINWQLTVT